VLDEDDDNSNTSSEDNGQNDHNDENNWAQMTMYFIFVHIMSHLTYR